MTLDAGTYSVEWFSVDGRETVPADEVAVETLLHLIREYARHCGHADLLRKSVDGLTGE